MRQTLLPGGPFQPMLDGFIEALPSEEAALGQAVNRNVSLALGQIREKYPTLAYHNESHTTRVLASYLYLMDKMQQAAPDVIGDRTVVVGALASAFHDICKVSTEDVSNGIRVRKDKSSESKKKSALFLRKMMQAENYKNGVRFLFTPEEARENWDAIERTVPIRNGNAIYDDTRGTSAVGLALCLADITSCGLDTGIFIAEGDRLFRESYPGLSSTIFPLGSLASNRALDLAQSWTHNQQGFVVGRKKYSELEIEAADVPDEAKQAAKDCLTSFDDSLERLGRLADARDSMRPLELMRSMGFSKVA